ncbi:MAG: (2Fe-2S) ferredoxin domain-containing protein [Thermovenabulum sp.]|uniref:(2Fe-2S) ferredoxin domain-containing protein n=1 Tax=Thermovenabulum sp. TaxID=3100335 RepID=UPI003C7BBA0D
MRKLSVCVGSSCHLKGAYDIIKIFEKMIKENKLEDEIELSAEFCCGNCTRPVSVKIDNGDPFSVTREGAYDFFKKHFLEE